jgi:hypothetical protein
MGFIELEGKSETRSIRIDKALNSELEREADRRETSISNLVERIIENYLNHYKWVDRVNALTILMPTMKKFLDHLDDETLGKIGAEIGGSVPRQGFIMRGIDVVDGDTAKLFILKILGGYDNWFTVDYHEGKDPYFFIRNQLGSKWIVFIEAYLRAFYRDTYGKEIKCERIGDNLQVILI